MPRSIHELTEQIRNIMNGVYGKVKATNRSSVYTDQDLMTKRSKGQVAMNIEIEKRKPNPMQETSRALIAGEVYMDADVDGKIECGGNCQCECEAALFKILQNPEFANYDYFICRMPDPNGSDNPHIILLGSDPQENVFCANSLIFSSAAGNMLMIDVWSNDIYKMEDVVASKAQEDEVKSKLTAEGLAVRALLRSKHPALKVLYSWDGTNKVLRVNDDDDGKVHLYTLKSKSDSKICRLEFDYAAEKRLEFNANNAMHGVLEDSKIYNSFNASQGLESSSTNTQADQGSSKKSSSSWNLTKKTSPGGNISDSNIFAQDSEVQKMRSRRFEIDNETIFQQDIKKQPEESEQKLVANPTLLKENPSKHVSVVKLPNDVINTAIDKQLEKKKQKIVPIPRYIKNYLEEKNVKLAITSEIQKKDLKHVSIITLPNSDVSAAIEKQLEDAKVTGSKKTM